jgi:hypothetical protein
MANEIINTDVLLTINGALVGLQLVLLGFFGRKYIRKIDSNEQTLNQLKTEHCMIQKDKTGMK